MGFLSLFRRNTFEHGIHPAAHKELTCELPIRRLPFAPRLIVPLSQHGGAPAVALVKPGQEVVRGEPIARAAGFVSVPMHAPATGVVEAIRLMPSARGPKTESIVIRVYEGSTQEILYDDPRDVEAMTPDEIVQAVQNAGMVGLGGAAFPSHVKMRPPKEHRVDTLVVNGCECEPYLTCDHRLMLEQPEQLIAGIRIAMRAVGAERAVIGIEDNKLDAVQTLDERLPKDGPISVRAVPTKYPQGAEKMLVESLLRRRIPPGSFPSAVGVSVFNVGTLAQIGELLSHGRGVIERVVTVTGPGVRNPGNYLVPVGTPIRFLLEHAGATPKANELILGGPMMGQAASSLDISITKGTSGVTAFTDSAAERTHSQVYPCIRCGYCVDACPIFLNPSLLGMLAANEEHSTMAEEHNLMDCFECGSCSFVCPSHIPLVQQFRAAKAAVRKAKAGAA